jgi:hypothetical protein
MTKGEGHMSCLFRSAISCVFLFAMFGCRGESGTSSWSAAELVPDAGGEGTGSGFVGHQGRLLLGFKNPDIRNVKLLTLSGAHVIDGGQLVANGVAGRDVIGAALQSAAIGGGPIDMRIADALSPDQTGAGWQYVLEEQDAAGAWQPACDTPTPIVPGDPVASPPRALAMNGAWQGDGLYLADSDNISFACETGAVGKCAAWGYPVSATPPSVTEHGLPTTATGADLAQACSRMARADYCVLGVPNTLEGTPIRYDDIFRTPPDAPGFLFEAAWPGVAQRRGQPAQRPTPICLSKLRWSTLPLGGGCAVTLPDPRTDSKGEFCEDLTPQQLEQAGALVYSSSTFLDAGLYTFTDTQTMSRLTTAHLLPGPVGTPPAWWKIPQPQGVPFPGPHQTMRLEATIFAPELPPSVPSTGLLTLASYRCTSDILTTTSVPPAGCTKIADEGHVYPPNTPGRTPLRRWLQRITHRSLTTTTPASSMIATGWQLVEVVGGVLRGEMSVNLRWSALAGAVVSLDVLTRTGNWIAPCRDVNFLGSVTQWEYRGSNDCMSASRTPGRGEIAAFRINYTVGGQTVSAVAPYDDVAGDVYLDLPAGTTTAVTIAWNDVGQGARYTLDVRSAGGDWVRCADANQLANDTGFVLTGRCPSTGGTVSLPALQQLRVCTTDAVPVCGQASYDGRAPRVAIAVGP